LGVDGGPVTKVLGSEWMDKIRRGVEEWRPRIDYQVTQDPSRLARIKGSLNGKAGFIVQDATQGFQPSPRVLTPFRGSLEVLPARTITGVTMLGYDVELREGRWEEVPAWLAVMLELKGLLRNARGEVVVRRINPPVGGPMMGSR
ncbi:MAG: hypothetical protein GSR86_02110, partial [Desulfurococcales archaeon]|nr:hypothetical protein [Desulfurococcales archaeon]